MSERLFENTVPREDGETFNPVPIEEDVSQATVTWGDDMLPVEWLFAKDGRGSLVAYALQEITEGDLRYYNKSGLADAAGVSRHSCHRHLEDLVELGLYDEIDEEGSHARYCPNAHSRILRALYTANRAAEEYGSNPL